MIEGNPPVLLHNGDRLLMDAFMYLSMFIAHARRGRFGQQPHPDVQWLRARRMDETGEAIRDQYEREHRWFCCAQRFKTERGARQHARTPFRHGLLRAADGVEYRDHAPRYVPYVEPA